MIRKLVPFRRWHLQWLGDSVEPGPTLFDAATLDVLERGNSWTGVIDDEVVFCAGTMAQWPTRHVSWALLGKNSGRHMRWITRMVRGNLDGVKGRVELTVRTDFPQGMRWAEMLGFHIETGVLACYGPEGEDHVGFVRINRPEGED